jgi:MFS family permease
MTRNLYLVLGTAMLFGASTGVYEYILPLYLKSQGISFAQMGGIFALAGLAMVVARIYMGSLADLWGRKRLYGWALALCGTACGLAPCWPGMLGQLVLKTLRETAALTRETIYPIILFEEQRAAFLNYIGKFRGVEYLFQAGGTLVAGLLVARMTAGSGITDRLIALGWTQPPGAYELLLYLAGAVLVLGGLWWACAFREHPRAGAQRIVSLRELVSFDLHPNLRIILISGIVFTFGLQLSHSFYMPLFFKEQYGASAETVALIMVIHRITLALPLLIVGQLRLRNFKRWYIAGLIIQGLTTGAAALMPAVLSSAVFFLLHDLIGAGIWSPIQATLIQRYSRDATRGLEVGKVLAWTSLGSIVGPLAAGFMAEQATWLPFFCSGLFMALAAIPLCWLNLNLPGPEEAPVAHPAAAAAG